MPPVVPSGSPSSDQEQTRASTSKKAVMTLVQMSKGRGCVKCLPDSSLKRNVLGNTRKRHLLVSTFLPKIQNHRHVRTKICSKKLTDVRSVVHSLFMPPVRTSIVENNTPQNQLICTALSAESNLPDWKSLGFHQLSINETVSVRHSYWQASPNPLSENLDCNVPLSKFHKTPKHVYCCEAM